MGELRFVYGDILDCEEKMLCHQCNCVTRHADGLAKQIFDKWPSTNVYEQRQPGNSFAGDVNYSIIHSEFLIPLDEEGSYEVGKMRTVVNMYGQVYPGKPRWGIDSKEKRLDYNGSTHL